MKKTKNNLAIAMALSVTLVVPTLAAPLTAYADISTPATPASEKPVLMAAPQNLVNYLKGDAVVKAPFDNGKLLVTVNDQEVSLTISDETLAISTKTGLPSAIKELKANDRIFVYYSAAMTRSLPPQSHGIAIITEIEKDNNHAQLFTVKEVVSRKEGDVRALNKEGDLIVSFTKDSALTPFKTKQIVRPSDITVGTQLFIWYDIVAMSYPGQTSASKAVLIGQEEGMGPRAVYTPWTGLDGATVNINDVAIKLTDNKLKDQNGLLMLPLSTAAQQLGFNVTWNSEDRSVLLDNGTVKTTITIGKDSYFKASSKAIGLTQGFSLGAEPTIVNGRTYVPASLFNLLYSDNEAVKLEITKQ